MSVGLRLKLVLRLQQSPIVVESLSLEAARLQ